MKPQTSLMEYCATKFNTFKNFLYTNYGENPGKMLVHTGVLGWILSSAAQVAAVVINDKISPKDKVFLIPQECADAAVNILSFYLVTNSFKAVGSKLVQSGKLVTKPIKNFLNEKQLCSQVGKIDFDITKQPGFDKISDDYKTFKNGVDVIFSTVGSIISCNIITPVLRNRYAARKQKEILAKKNQNTDFSQTPGKPYSKDTVLPRVSLADYQKLAAMKFSSNMKI